MSNAPTHNTPPLLFIAHAQVDEPHLLRLLQHLQPLENKGLFTIWHRGKITAGQEKATATQQALKKADTVLLLVSSDLIADEWYQVVKRGLLQQQTTKVVPALLRACLWKEEDFLKCLQPLPDTEEFFVKDRQPLSDQSCVTIVQAIKQVVTRKTVSTKPTAAPKLGQNTAATQYQQKRKKKITLWGVISIIALITGFYMIKDIGQGAKQNTTSKITSNPNALFEKDDSLFTILVIRFEDYIANKETECIGRSIYTNLEHIRTHEGLPLKPLYVDSIMSPQTPEAAKIIQERHNANLLMYGLANQIKPNCLGANVCFRHFVADTIMANVTVPSDMLNTSKHGLKYQQTSPFDIEQGKLSINEQSMKAWIKSLIALKVDDEEKALLAIERMVSKDTIGLSKEERAEQYFSRGNAYRRLQQYEKAIKDFDKAILLNPDDAIIFNNRGVAYAYLEQYEKAIKDYNKVILLKPDAPYAFYNRGFAYTHLQQYEKAIKDHDKAILLNPDYPYAFNNRGVAYRDLQQYDKAIKDFDKAILLNPDDAIIFNNRGVTYAYLEHYEKAIKDYDKAILLNPDYATALYNRGLAYAYLEHYEKAIKDYDKAILLKPDFAFVFKSRGVVYYTLEQYEKAIKDYDKAILLNPDNALAFYGRGLAYADLQQYHKAIKDYDKAILLKPDFELAINNRNITLEILKNN